MKPLSKKRRRVYFIIFCIIFVIGAPFFIMDAKGYKFNWTGVIKVSQTGGLYISTDQSGIEIYVDNELVRKTSIVQKSIFVQNLKPGSYEVRVTKEGLQEWSKTLKVFPEIVTEARSFLVRSEPELVEVPKLLSPQGTNGTTSSRSLLAKNPEYDPINALFLPPVVSKTVPTKLSTTSQDSKTLGDIFVKNEAGKLHVSWIGAVDSLPNYFCENITCKQEIVIKAPSNVLSFDFYPGRNDLLILRLKNGVYVSEIDDRSRQNIQKITSESDFDFRIKDGKKLYLKKDGKIYSVSL